MILRSGLTIVDQEDDEDHEHDDSGKDPIDYESYGSDNESAGNIILKKLSTKSKSVQFEESTM